MLKVLMIMLLVFPANATHFPIAPIGMCYDGCEKLIKDNAYPGAVIAYNSSINHVWLLQGNRVIDTYFGEMSLEAAGYVPEKIFSTWEEFDASLMRIDITDL